MEDNTQLWLSQIDFDTRSRTVRSDIADPRSMKKSLMKLVPDDLGEGHRSKAGMLFRVESGTNVLVQTYNEPNSDRLPPGYFIKRTVEFGTSFEPEIGLAVRYRCRTTPIKRTGSKERFLIGEDEILWWKERLGKAGLSALGEWESTSEEAKFRDWRSMRFVNFEGVAEVANVDLLKETIRVGIGRNKNWGAGLLSLALVS